MKQWIELTQEQQEAVTAALAYPFAPDEIEWLALATYEKDGQYYAKGGAYADLRAYQYRLDTVCGQNWNVRYRALPTPPKGNVGVICSLTIYGRTMEDVGEAAADDPNAWTSAVAQAFKRTASALQRIGRYLYDQDAPWVLYDKAKKRFTKEGDGVLNKHYFAWYVQATGQKTVRERQAPQLQTSNEQQQTTSTPTQAAPAAPVQQQQQAAPQQQQQQPPPTQPAAVTITVPAATANPAGPITDATKREICATAQAIFGEADWVDALAWYTAAFAKTPLAVTHVLNPDQFQQGEAETFLGAMVKNAAILPGYWTDVKAQVAASRAAQTPPQPQRQAQPAMRLN